MACKTKQPHRPRRGCECLQIHQSRFHWRDVVAADSGYFKILLPPVSLDTVLLSYLLTPHQHSTPFVVSFLPRTSAVVEPATTKARNCNSTASHALCFARQRRSLIRNQGVRIQPESRPIIDLRPMISFSFCLKIAGQLASTLTTWLRIIEPSVVEKIFAIFSSRDAFFLSCTFAAITPPSNEAATKATVVATTITTTS